ncbi:MAG: TonB-dependent receptor [Alphaproteobacteria bacterium]|nr:TonB-dependent receptor [Alphaproteobacteria bacterium]
MLAISPKNLAAQQDTNATTKLSLEYLMNVEVTTASNRPEVASDVASAIHVLSREEILQAGVTNIPDALRLVPGVNVAQINRNSWAISIRGFNSRFANKLLVLIDGRSVYTPLFSGVFWDHHNVPIDNIERIEVVRGPGGSVWGSNAVNGVINIITRHSLDSQGNEVVASVGTEPSGSLYARTGAVLNDDATYRASFRLDGAASSDTPGGRDGNDDWRNAQADVRVDWSLSSIDDLMISAGVNAVRNGDLAQVPAFTAPYSMVEEHETERFGLHLLARWDRQYTEDENLMVQGYVDHRDNEVGTPEAQDARTVVDFQTRYYRPVLSEGRVHVGGGVQVTKDSLDDPTLILSISDDDETVYILNAFAEGSWDFLDDRLTVTAGTKIEHHSISGTELQPSVRLLARPAPNQTIWAAVSSATRTPSRIENDGTIRQSVIPPGTPQNPGPLPATIATVGTRALEAERVIAYEIGHRARITPRLSTDVTAFYNDYEDLALNAFFLGTSVNNDYGSPFVEISNQINNAGSATVYGAEASATWEPWDDVRMRGGYSFLHEDFDNTSGVVEGNSPRHQAFVQSLVSFGQGWSIGATLRYVDRLDNVDADGYVDADLSIGWMPMETIKLQLTGRNLFTDGRREFGTENETFPTILATDLERSVFATLRVTF